MNLSKIFTEKNLAILGLISKEEKHLRDISSKLKCSSGTVHKAVSLFKKLGFINETKEKNRKIYSLNTKNQILRKILSLININRLLSMSEFIELTKRGTVGVYGSYADGTNTRLSDLDLWIYTNEKWDKLQRVKLELQNKLGLPVNLLILNKDRLDRLKKEDYEFYIRLRLTSIQKEGDIFGS